MSKSIKGLIPASSKSDKQRDADMQPLQKFDIEITKAKTLPFPLLQRVASCRCYCLEAPAERSCRIRQ